MVLPEIYKLSLFLSQYRHILHRSNNRYTQLNRYTLLNQCTLLNPLGLILFTDAQLAAIPHLRSLFQNVRAPLIAILHEATIFAAVVLLAHHLYVGTAPHTLYVPGPPEVIV